MRREPGSRREMGGEIARKRAAIFASARIEAARAKHDGAREDQRGGRSTDVRTPDGASLDSNAGAIFSERAAGTTTTLDASVALGDEENATSGAVRP